MVQSRAINFSAPGSLAFNFGGNIAAWGADIQSIGGRGLINFSVNGLSQSCPDQLHVPRVCRFLFPDIRRIAVQRHVLTLTLTGQFLAADGANVSFLIDNVIATTAVPEPSTLLLLSAGAGLYRSGSPPQEAARDSRQRRQPERSIRSGVAGRLSLPAPSA